MVTELNNGLNAHARPPEIMMAEMPTEDQTADLFRLCEEQRLCFRIIIRTLKAEKEGKPVQQLKMCIMGQAGTGKSEIMNAVIWHSFQHEMNRLIGASAYQWKPALLIRTANTQAVSCCTFFGINNFQKNSVPGSTESSRLYFTEDIKLLFIDEFGTLSLPFLSVSVNKKIRGTIDRKYRNTSPSLYKSVLISMPSRSENFAMKLHCDLAENQRRVPSAPRRENRLHGRLPHRHDRRLHAAPASW